MADNRDQLARMLAAGQTGGLTPGDFTTFANKLNNAEALQGWYDAGGIFSQNGGSGPPDPEEQYFGNKGLPSGSTPETSWMASLQPWQQGGQGGGETSYQSQQMIYPGFVGAGAATRADPAYWGYQGAHQGYAPGSMGDISGFNNNRSSSSGSRGGTGGLSQQDFATFSRLVSPTALQDWLNAGGVQGMASGGYGGYGGYGGGSSSGGGGGSSGSGGGGYSGSGGGSSGSSSGSSIGSTAQGGNSSGNTGYSGYAYGPAGTPTADGVNSINSAGAGVIGGFGPSGFGNTPNSTLGISGYGQATIGAATDAYGNSTYGQAPGTTGNGPFGGESSTGWGGFSY